MNEFSKKSVKINVKTEAAFNLLKSVFALKISEQEQRPGDYFKDGILFCGKCGQPRRKRVYVEFPAESGQSLTIREMLVPDLCQCDIAERENYLNDRLREEKALLRKNSLIDDIFSAASFEKLTINSGNEQSLKMCRNYSRGLERFNEKGLLLCGPTGTGKSTAAACIANELLKNGIPVIMTSFVKILEQIDSDRTWESAFIDRMRFVNLVIFDDLGAERSTDYALEKVYNIVDARYRSKKPMVLTTNLEVKAMMNEADIRYKRIYERIFEVCHPVIFAGTNWRVESAKKSFSAFEKILLQEDK